MSTNISAEQLRSFIERIENVEEELAQINEQRKEIYNEAKSLGYEVKIIRQIVRLRKMERNDRMEQEALLELYKETIGID